MLHGVLHKWEYPPTDGSEVQKGNSHIYFGWFEGTPIDGKLHIVLAILPVGRCGLDLQSMPLEQLHRLNELLRYTGEQKLMEPETSWRFMAGLMDDLWMVNGWVVVASLCTFWLHFPDPDKLPSADICGIGTSSTKPVLPYVAQLDQSPTPTGHGLNHLEPRVRLNRRSLSSRATTLRLADLRASMTSSTLEKDVLRVLRASRRGGRDGEIRLQQKVENFFELDILIGWGWGC